MHLQSTWSCVLLLFLSGKGSPAPTFIPEGERVPALQPQNDLKHATEYLRQYYNLKKEPFGRGKRSWPSFTSKVKDMQSFFSLNTTGVLDPETVEVMKTPRCGVPDVDDYTHNHGNRWNKNVITYNIGRYTSDLPHSTVDSLIESALSVWSRASTLTFVRSPTRVADIMVEFATYEHGDLYPFDGPKGTLAHAYGPGDGTGGDTHFDDDETWTAGPNGFNLYLVAAHEFGHALGLKHSRNPDSLMYPTYRPRSLHNPLSWEDMTNINSLYGKQNPMEQLLYRYLRTGWSLPSNPWLVGTPFPSTTQKCAPSLSFDAVSTVGDSTFFFSDRYLWIKHNQQYDIKEGSINNFMPKIETKIDAAFWVPRRSTAYLFHESMYWVVKGSLVKGKPKPISNFGLPPWVQEVDAAVHIVKTGRTFFFSHDIYWSYNENRRVMDIGYPQYISDDFPGVDGNISAAVHKDGFIFFFIGPQVYKYDYTLKEVVGIEKANTWLGC
ncbi:matrilysin-like [Osmerus eperlanus]|uniref:matrilysin-like n=1 Tax=Osmerus eperlanus TaxID=29151 RepID=UPI002E15DFE3